MHSYIQISKLNDFVFDPISIYYHSIYESFDASLYHALPQVNGNIAHESIDNAYYSTSKDILHSTPVFSEKYGLVGKIDIYDTKSKSLIERKFKVKNIYDGYKYQLYAQFFAMTERGFEVNQLVIHSLSDNKRYFIPLPNEDEIGKFEHLIDQLRAYHPNPGENVTVEDKLNNCIYKNLYI